MQDATYRIGAVLVLSTWLLSTGCRTVDPDAARAFGVAAADAKSQSQVVFASVNDLTQENIIKHAAEQETLDETNFFVVIPNPEEQQWLNAFSLLESYGNQLALLSSYKSGAEFRESMQRFATQLKRTTDVEVSPGLAVGFTKLGGKLLEYSARRDAKKLASQANPEVQQIVVLMADAIGTSSKEKLRGTVRVNFDQHILNPLVREFNCGTKANKLRVARKYSEELAKRDEVDLSLANLRRSILNLGCAHAALAQGSRVEVLGYLDVIRSDLADAKQMLDELTTRRSDE